MPPPRNPNQSPNDPRKRHQTKQTDVNRLWQRGDDVAVADGMADMTNDSDVAIERSIVVVIVVRLLLLVGVLIVSVFVAVVVWC